MQRLRALRGCVYGLLLQLVEGVVGKRAEVIVREEVFVLRHGAACCLSPCLACPKLPYSSRSAFNQKPFKCC